jgi:hypothetical protein
LSRHQFSILKTAWAARITTASPILTCIFCLACLILWARPAFAEIGTDRDAPAPSEIEVEWSGRIKLQSTISWPDEDSFIKLINTDTSHDASADLRLMSKLFFGDRAYLETHYEVVVYGGETREKLEELKDLIPPLSRWRLLPGEPINDDRRLMDLTKVFSEKDSYAAYHRIDRLALTLLPDWGTLRIGRQAITWGNGFVFNPMDLFNPFAPTDIERDYKIGDDMITIQFPVGQTGDMQFLYVPRREPIEGDVEWDSESSYAAKAHFSVGTTEFDLLGARHFEDHVVGLGSAGYLGGAAWRADATWTFLRDGHGRDGYLSFVANTDYSWTWDKRNWYGFIEFHFNGLGDDDPEDAFSDPDVIERMERGELFALGRAYLSGTVQVELHPLFNFFLTSINNLNDPSGIIQPRAIWDVAENFLITVGGNIGWGEEGTEFGGLEIPRTELLTTAPDTAFVWLNYYF